MHSSRIVGGKVRTRYSQRNMSGHNFGHSDNRKELPAVADVLEVAAGQ
jgi:hypothetical protein